MRITDCGLRNEGSPLTPALSPPIGAFEGRREGSGRLHLHSACRTPHAKGFTLIELAVVIAVLAIMILVVVPTVGELTGANLTRSARRLTSVIRHLREEAEATKTVYRLRFDVQNGQWWAEVLTVTPDGTAEFKRLSSAFSAEGSLSGETAFRDVRVGSHPDDPSMLFTPDGWVEKAFLHLRDGNGRDHTLIVKPLTGNTELREGDVEER